MQSKVFPGKLFHACHVATTTFQWDEFLVEASLEGLGKVSLVPAKTARAPSFNARYAGLGTNVASREPLIRFRLNKAFTCVTCTVQERKV